MMSLGTRLSLQQVMLQLMFGHVIMEGDTLPHRLYYTFIEPPQTYDPACVSVSVSIHFVVF